MKTTEIERKFLVLNHDFKAAAFRKERIVQAFLSSVPERTVRVRLLGEKGLLTVKGIGNQSGTTRFEWEREISLSDAEQLLKLCEPGAIDKERYYVKVISHIFEIDVFHLDNEGLIVAEIELEAEHESFFKPSWLGEEVTGQPKYYNASLSKFPYKHWK